MAFYCTANGSSPGHCGKSYDLILSGVTKRNQLEVLSKKKIEKKEFIGRNSRFKILKITKCFCSFPVTDDFMIFKSCFFGFQTRGRKKRNFSRKKKGYFSISRKVEK